MYSLSLNVRFARLLLTNRIRVWRSRPRVWAIFDVINPKAQPMENRFELAQKMEIQNGH